MVTPDNIKLVCCWLFYNNFILDMQKAVSEVVAYIKDSVVPEGLILRPPYPLSDSEEEKEERKGEEEKRRRQRNNGHNKVSA